MLVGYQNSLPLLARMEGGTRHRTTGGNRGPFPPRQFVYPARNL